MEPLSLNEFLGASSSPEVEAPEPAVDTPAPVAPVTPEEPQFVTSVTPSGIEVLYQWAPKRLYKVRHTEPQMGAGKPKDYDWSEVPSVTTVLGVLDKPALPWWGMKIGVQGVLELVERGVIPYALYEDGIKRLSVLDRLVLVPADVDNVVPLLTQNQLTVNHVRDQAGDRGTNVHDAFENWAKDGTVPQPTIYPEHERGYVEALLAFLRDTGLEAEEAEIMVGSIAHGFAGRYDLRGNLPKSVELVVHRTPKRGPQLETFEAGRYLWDLKTSKDFYESHFMQLEAYELASVECGYDATDARAVVVVAADGTYKVERSKATSDDFLAVKSAHDALEDLKKRRKRRAKKETK